MARCPPEALADLAAELAAIRGWDGVVEKSFACFYLKSQGFLHFHVKGPERWADARRGKDWGEPLAIAPGASAAARKRFLAAARGYYEETRGVNER